MNYMHFLDPLTIIKTFGLLGLTLIVFAESGLFFGFFLPGDSLLFTAGLLASQGNFNIALLLILLFLAATLGDTVGYWFGARYGVKLFNREQSFFFRPEYVKKTSLFFEKHGKKALVIARFMPIVRTFAPILAGVGGMKYKTFLSYNIIGGALWVLATALPGFILGNTVPNIERYIIPIAILIIFTSFIPSIVEIVRNRRRKTDLTP